MIIVEFDGQDLLLGAPKGWNQKGGVECGFLPVRVEREGGHVVMVSYWRPTAEELAIIAAGGHVKLEVYGGSHPPVRVGAELGIEERP